MLSADMVLAGSYSAPSEAFVKVSVSSATADRKKIFVL
jgi:hypothetical protein